MTDFYKTYCPPCEECGDALDWPGANIPVGRPYIKAQIDGSPPLLEAPVKLMCTKCILEALVNIDTPIPENPRAGWLYRLIKAGQLDPAGIPKPTRILDKGSDSPPSS